MTLEELKSRPTLSSGPVNDLKLDTGRTQVWVRRQGSGPAITVKYRYPTKWVVVGEFSKEVSTTIRNKIAKDIENGQAVKLA